MEDILGVATPRAVTPRTATPFAMTPRMGTPMALTPRMGTPMALTPRAATPRLGTPERGEKEMSTWQLFKEETKKLSYIATIMVLVTTSQYLLRFVSMLMVGHLGKLELSGAVVAMSLTNVTGFSLLVSHSLLFLIFDLFVLWFGI